MYDLVFNRDPLASETAEDVLARHYSSLGREGARLGYMSNVNQGVPVNSGQSQQGPADTPVVMAASGWAAQAPRAPIVHYGPEPEQQQQPPNWLLLGAVAFGLWLMSKGK